MAIARTATRSTAAAVVGLQLLAALLFAQVGGAVCDPAQLGVELGQLEQGMLLPYIGFHRALQYSRGRCGSSTDPYPQGRRRSATRSSAAAWSHHGYSLAQCATSTRATSLARPVLVGGMVAKVGGQVGLHTGACGRVEQRIPRTAAHRDPRHRQIRVAGRAHAPRGGGQPGADPGDEIAQRLRFAASSAIRPSPTPVGSAPAR